MFHRTIIDDFRDHLLGCGSGPMRIRRHDASCGMPCFRIILAISRNKGVVLIWIVLVMCFILIFSLVSLIDVPVHHPLQNSLLCLSAATAGVTAECGKADKDYHYEAVVQAARGEFVPLVVECLGLWSPNSLGVLKNSVFYTTSKSDASPALACNRQRYRNVY